MARNGVNKLSDRQIRTAKAAPGKQVKLSDGDGLFLLISEAGGKLWRHSYRFDGKQKTSALGKYPAVSLATARERHAEARALLAKGLDPGAAREQPVAEKPTTFRDVALTFLHKKKGEGRAPATLAKLTWIVDKIAPETGEPSIAAIPIADLTAPAVLKVLDPLDSAGMGETAHRARAVIGEICRFACARGLANSDPTALLRGALKTHRARPRSAILEPVEFGSLLRAIDSYPHAVVRLYLQLLALTFVRPGELRLAEWAEFDVAGNVWRVPETRIKMRRAFDVPLAPQTLAALASLRAITGTGRLLFPSPRSAERPLSENAGGAALAYLGFSSEQHSPHGFRSTFSTIANGSGKFQADVIELCLAHEIEGVRGVYNRAAYWPERVALVTWWAHRLDALRAGAP